MATRFPDLLISDVVHHPAYTQQLSKRCMNAVGNSGVVDYCRVATGDILLSALYVHSCKL